VWHL